MANNTISTVPGSCPASKSACPFTGAFYADFEKNILAGNRMTVKHIAAACRVTPIACRTAMVNHYTMPNSKFHIGFTKGRTGGITLTAA